MKLGKTVLIFTAILGLSGIYLWRYHKESTSHIASTDRPLVGIAVIYSDSENHVANLLNQSHVNGVISGSVVFGVNVPKSDATRAINILREDASKHKYFIKFPGIWPDKDFKHAL